MKKCPAIFPLLLLCSLSLHAQSVSFNNLVYFTSLTNGEVHQFLLQGDAFRQDYTENINGLDLEFFKNINAKPNTEKLITGNSTKLADGTILHMVQYTSTNSQFIISMISQAKRYGLELKFRGVDATNNIYLYDNDFYHVSIFLKRDQSSGLVEVKQKEYLGLE